MENYDLDVESGGDFTLSQPMVYNCGGHITTDHWIACNAILVFYAGAAFSKLLSITRNAVKEATMMELYESTIAALDTSSFFVSANCFFTRTFRRIAELLTAEHLYCNYHDYRTKMRNILLPLFPKDLVTMKSSRGFNKSCKSVYVTTFGRGVSKLKEFHVVLKNTRGNLSPQYWEYTKSSW